MYSTSPPPYWTSNICLFCLFACGSDSKDIDGVSFQILYSTNEYNAQMHTTNRPTNITVNNIYTATTSNTHTHIHTSIQLITIAEKKVRFPFAPAQILFIFGEDSRFARSKTVNEIEVATKLRGIQCIQRYTTVKLVIIPCRVVSYLIVCFVLFYFMFSPLHWVVPRTEVQEPIT